MHLVEIGHRAIAVGDVAQLADRGDVAIHRIDRLEADELGPVRGHAVEQSCQIVWVAVAKDVLLGPAVADAGDHRGVVQRIGKHDRPRHLARQGRQGGIVGDIARGEDQRRLAAVQVGDLALEQQVEMVVARDVAGAAGPGTHRPQRLLHCREHRRMLTHAEIVVRAPDRDLGADAVVEGARKPAAAPLDVGKDAVASLGAQCVEAFVEEAVVIHCSSRRPCV